MPTFIEKLLTTFGFIDKKAQEDERQFQAVLAHSYALHDEMILIEAEIRAESDKCRAAIWSGDTEAFDRHHARRVAMVPERDRLSDEINHLRPIIRSYV